MKKIYIFLLFLMALLSCQKEPYDTMEIVFDSMDEVDGSTKAVTPVTATTLGTSGFNVSATTGSAGSEVTVWNSVAFSKSGSVFKGGKYWPKDNGSYNFYASNNVITFQANGSRVTASTADNKDVVCAYLPYGTTTNTTAVYKAQNRLTFNHIFARIGDVTVSSTGGYTITGVSISITPNVSGNYNIRQGNASTDATGWSSLSAGSATNVANTTPGTKSNDLYLVPGTYTLTLGWTATKGDWSKTYSGITKSVAIVKGKVNSISCTLGGEATEIVLSLSLSAWGSNSIAMSYSNPFENFGGLNLAPGPLTYNNGYQISESWSTTSYNSKCGAQNGSTFFTFLEIGKYFDSRGNSFADLSGPINNNGSRVVYRGYKDWRVPTNSDWSKIITNGSTRSGSTVNGTSGVKYALVELTGVTYAGDSTPEGLLVFPDGKTMSGKALSATNTTSTKTTGVTVSQLDSYISQGCVFVPFSGIYLSSWESGGSHGYYHTTDGNNLSGTEPKPVVNSMCYTYTGSASFSLVTTTAYYLQVYLVRNAN